MRIAFLGPWSGPALAAIAALILALLLRAMKQVPLSGLAAPAGIAIGWIVTLGLVLASPRQLPERLPLLALVALPFGLAAQALAARQVMLWGIAGIACIGTGWWMAGAPLHGPDLQRAAITMATVAVAAMVAFALMQAAWQAFAASLALAAALLISGATGPGWLLALVALAATLAGWAGGAAPGPAMRLPLGMMIAALVAIPPLARGAPVDWLVAAAPPAALLLGPILARRLPPELVQVVAALLAAMPLLLVIAWHAGRLN